MAKVKPSTFRVVLGLGLVAIVFVFMSFVPKTPLCSSSTTSTNRSVANVSGESMQAIIAGEILVPRTLAKSESNEKDHSSTSVLTKVESLYCELMQTNRAAMTWHRAHDLVSKMEFHQDELREMLPRLLSSHVIADRLMGYYLDLEIIGSSPDTLLAAGRDESPYVHAFVYYWLQANGTAAEADMFLKQRASSLNNEAIDRLVTIFDRMPPELSYRDVPDAVLILVSGINMSKYLSDLLKESSSLALQVGEQISNPKVSDDRVINFAEAALQSNLLLGQILDLLIRQGRSPYVRMQVLRMVYSQIAPGDLCVSVDNYFSENPNDPLTPDYMQIKELMRSGQESEQQEDDDSKEEDYEE